MGRFTEPIKGTKSLRLNRTLHGRSVHRKQDVPGHNVFKGYNNPGTGDGIDFFDDPGTPVYAIADGIQTRWMNDMTKREVVYLEGPGWVAVYAHINASVEGVGRAVKKGQQIGTLRGDLSDPHLHFELWMNGKALHGSTPAIFRRRIVAALGLGDA